MTFNGYAGQYVKHPPTADPGELVRFWVVDAGPSIDTDFHIVGTIFNRAYPFADLTDPGHALRNVQTVTVPAGGGGVFDVKIDQPGLYPFVSHAVAALDQGQVGLLKVGAVEGTMSHLPHPHGSPSEEPHCGSSRPPRDDGKETVEAEATSERASVSQAAPARTCRSRPPRKRADGGQPAERASVDRSLARAGRACEERLAGRHALRDPAARRGARIADGEGHAGRVRRPAVPVLRRAGPARTPRPDRRLRPGREAAHVFRGLAFIGPDSQLALRTAVAAGQQNKLWDVVHAVYQDQGVENSGWVTDALLGEIAAGAALDYGRLTVERTRPRVEKRIASSAHAAAADGVTGTPAFAAGHTGRAMHLVPLRSLGPAIAAGALLRLHCARRPANRARSGLPSPR